MKNKKENKSKESTPEAAKEVSQIANKADLRTFISDVHDRLLKEQAAPIFAMAAMQQVMSLDNIYDLLDNQNKESVAALWPDWGIVPVPKEVRKLRILACSGCRRFRLIR